MMQMRTIKDVRAHQFTYAIACICTICIIRD